MQARPPSTSASRSDGHLADAADEEVAGARTAGDHDDEDALEPPAQLVGGGHLEHGVAEGRAHRVGRSRDARKSTATHSAPARPTDPIAAP